MINGTILYIDNYIKWYYYKVIKRCFITYLYLNANNLNKNERRNSMLNRAIKIKVKIQKLIIELSFSYETKIQ